MDKDNDKNYWFKRRRYGYGWIPVTWQGWLSLGAFLAIVIVGGMVLVADTPKNEFTREAVVYLALVFAAFVGLFILTLKKGLAPKWRWGKSDIDDKDQDY